MAFTYESYNPHKNLDSRHYTETENLHNFSKVTELVSGKDEIFFFKPRPLLM